MIRLAVLLIAFRLIASIQTMEEKIATTFTQIAHTAMEKTAIQQRLQHLPENIKPLGTQVAGHVNGLFLKNNFSKVLFIYRFFA